MTLLRLEREEHHASRHIERCEFALAPIHLLGDTPDCLDVQGGIRLLSHICSYWRAVALSTPGLWTALSFQGSARGRRDAPALVGLWLERAKDRPISVRYDYEGGLEGTLEQAHVAMRIFKLLLLHRNQWKEAHLHAPFHMLAQTQFGSIHAPFLQHLVLHDPDIDFDLPWSQIKSYTGPFSPKRNSHIFFDATNLEDCVLISPLHFPNTLAPIVHQHLRRLHLQASSMVPDTLTLTALQSLRFCAGDVSDCVPSIQRLLQRSSPLLTGLHIDDFIHSDEIIHVLGSVANVAELTICTPADVVPSIAETENFFRFFAEDEPGLDIEGPVLPSLQRLDLKGLPLGDIAVRVLEQRARPPASSSSVVRLGSLTLADVHDTSTTNLVKIVKLPGETGLELDAGAVYAVR
ncbi:hypothetical protein FB45DRAFT_1067565 [Roridomyces roridus]|uniref:F-box domain-containing protein n=1 Tax=Roridomyces roridus TaxID=1738132 RepID=A0AAD7B320_9AGAR|nr:hypothetical protein FB45DRAFT_1067565 [Roridomyces roridus]